ncbi:hypothetical protein MC885_013327 [Smutsia gigantea]|nr:hypothetical protein MC885_013327 [Smutsia gigantea]
MPVQDTDAENTQIPWAHPHILNHGADPLQSRSASCVAEAAVRQLCRSDETLFTSSQIAREYEARCSQVLTEAPGQRSSSSAGDRPQMPFITADQTPPVSLEAGRQRCA